MIKPFQSKTVLVYDSCDRYVGTVSASLLKAEAVSGSVDESDLAESINLVRHSNACSLTVFDKLTGIPHRFYRFGRYRRVVVGSDD